MKEYRIFSYTGGLVSTNAWVFQTEDVCLLFDAPGGVVRWLVGEGLRPDALILTHLHFDHVMGAAEVAETFGCPIWARERLSADLTLENEFRGFGNTSFAVAPFDVQMLIRSDDVMIFSGEPFGLFYVPGHSADSVCFWHKEAEFLVSGDTLFYDSMGRPDFLGGDGEVLVRGIQEKLFPLPVQTRVLPGHGPETTIGRERRENPYARL